MKCREAHGLAITHPRPACAPAVTAQARSGAEPLPAVPGRNRPLGPLSFGEKLAYLCGHEECHNSRPWGRKIHSGAILRFILPGHERKGANKAL